MSKRTTRWGFKTLSSSSSSAASPAPSAAPIPGVSVPEVPVVATASSNPPSSLLRPDSLKTTYPGDFFQFDGTLLALTKPQPQSGSRGRVQEQKEQKRYRPRSTSVSVGARDPRVVQQPSALRTQPAPERADRHVRFAFDQPTRRQDRSSSTGPSARSSR